MSHGTKVETTEFNSKDRLKDLAENKLPDASIRSLHLGPEVNKHQIRTDDDNERYQAPANQIEDKARSDVMAIINNKTGEVASMPSSGYAKIDHSKAIHPALEALNNLDIDIKGDVYIFNDGDGIEVEAHFKNHSFSVGNDPDDSDYMNGFILRNSYDSNAAVTLRAFNKRTVCSNGMIWMKGVAIDDLKRKHFGNVDIVDEYRAWLQNVIDASDDFANILNEAAGKQLGEMLKPLRNVGIGKRKRKDIRTMADTDPNEATRLDIYNAITSYVSEHVRGQSTTRTVDKYHRSACEVLTAPRSKLMADIDDEEQEA